uniref:Predicted protein n=1 Tax=Hordeum vulgare subsp. vulgare TaxID=112509 RepID=F2CZP7_HORVV|nr:predicted protein [Hordeum vulgare subsp. vulgare]
MSCSFDDPNESAVVLNSRQEGVEEFPLEPDDLILRSQQSRGRSPGGCQIQVPRGFCAGTAELEDSTVHIR